MPPVKPLSSLVTRSISAAERRFDRFRYRERDIDPDTLTLMPFTGHRTADRLILKGRVIETKEREPVGEGTLSRMRAMLSLYESDEVPGLPIELEAYGERYEVETDEEGYFTLDIDGLGRALPAETTLEEISVRVPETGNRASASVLAPGREIRRAVISDIDDTVLETGATNFLRNWRRVLVETPEERLVVPGAPDLYRVLTKTGGRPDAPVFYVSSSPWNLYGFLRRFMDHNGLPEGPMFLKDYGITDNSLLAEGHKAHKIDAIRHLFDLYKDFDFLLIGDDGQKDVDVYAEAARLYGSRVSGVFIRDVHVDGPHHAHAPELERLSDAGTKVYFGATMMEAIPVARSLGFAA